MLETFRLRVPMPSKGKKEYALKMLEMQKAKQERKGK
jgi:hypothetical protein